MSSLSEKFFLVIRWYLACWRPYRYSPAPAGIKDFLFPSMNRCFWVRIISLIIAAYLVFGFILIPTFIKGGSMEPTYHSVGFNFCWRGRYLYSKPQRHDIVVIRYVDKVLLLKRIVAFAGETVEFRNGVLFVNGLALKEPYVHYLCDWDLPPRKVKKGHVYVIGDNRSMPIHQHYFGQVAVERIYGAPLW